MKNFIKQNLKVVLAILVTAIICISGSVYATIKIQASQIEYNDTTVEEAINDLYSTTIKFETLNIRLQARSWSSTSDSSALFDFSPFNNIYQYFKVTSLSNSNLKSCSVYRWNKQTQSELEVLLNTQYSINDNANTFINVVNNNNTYGTCTAEILLYN